MMWRSGAVSAGTRVFLTNPPLNMAETPLQYHRPMVPLGLGYLGAILEDAFAEGRWSQYVRDRLAGAAPRGYCRSGRVAVRDNMFLSFYGRYDFDSLVSQIRHFAADGPEDELYIGMSVLSDGMRSARYMLRHLRMLFPLAKLMVGGPHATFFPYDFYESRGDRRGALADFVVRNEAERVILGIVAGELASGADIDLRGHAYGVNPDRCDSSDPDCLILDGGQFGADASAVGLGVLDRLPVPAYFLFEDEDGRLPYAPDQRYGLTAPAANINSSRGCPHKCTYCTIPKLAPGYRTMSPSRMIETVRFLVLDYEVRSLFFREDNFTYGGGSLPGDRWSDIELFADAMIAAGSPVRWAIEARADNLVAPRGGEDTRLQHLRRAGLSGVYMGVESGSDVMLKLYGKGADTRLMSEAVRACNANDVAVVATACYSDPDLLRRSRFALMDHDDPSYLKELVAQRESILNATRAFMDEHNVPPDRREEYVLVGIPVSATYQLLEAERSRYPFLVEYVDPDTRYLYPRGFRWWSDKVYDSKRLVRPYYGYDFSPPP